MIYAENNSFTITSIFGSKMSYFAWTITFTEPQLSNTGFNSVFKNPWSYPYLMMPWICLRHPKPAGAKQSQIRNSSMLECMGDVHLFEGYIWFCVNKEMVCFSMLKKNILQWFCRKTLLWLDYYGSSSRTVIWGILQSNQIQFISTALFKSNVTEGFTINHRTAPQPT